MNFDEKIVMSLFKELKLMWKLEQEIREQQINNDAVVKLLEKLDQLRKGSE